MFGLVSKKKLDIAMNNNKILNKQRMELERENKELQQDILTYKNSIVGDLKTVVQCKKCNNYFIPQRRNQTYCQHCINKRHKKGE